MAFCACGGGSGSSTGPATTAPTSNAAADAAAPNPSPVTNPGPTTKTIAPECTATASAIDNGTTGSQFELTRDVVVELTGLSSPSTVLMRNLTAAGSYEATLYELDPSNNCRMNGSATTVAGGGGITITLSNFGTAGTRHFVDLHQSAPSIAQVCSVRGSSATTCDVSKQLLFGSIQDATGAPVAGAKVSVANNGKLDATTTDGNGNFVLSTEIATLPSAFSATVSKTGLVPLSLGLVKPTNGRPIQLAPQSMTATGANYAVVEVEPLVHHLGDGNFSGGANSGFQYPTAEGPSYATTFTVEAASLAYASASVNFIAKGVECADQVLINGSLAFAMGNSSDDGSYSRYSIPVPRSLFAAGTNRISVVSKSCSGSDLDDFEFQNVVIQFQ